jgi:hypothetical protein
MVNEPKGLSRYIDWTTEVRFPAAMALFSLFQSVQTGSRSDPASYTMGEVFVQEQSGQDMKLTTHLYLVPRSRMMELCLHYHTPSSWHDA